jgi:hypothetical protein
MMDKSTRFADSPQRHNRPRGIALILVALGLAMLFTPEVAKANPATTVSRYTGGSGTTSTNDFYSLGCTRASGPVGAVVLAFGAPKYDSTYGWGVDPPGYTAFWTINDVKEWAKQFAAGVYNCRGSSTNVSMIVGTTTMTPLGEGSNTHTATRGRRWLRTSRPTSSPEPTGLLG